MFYKQNFYFFFGLTVNAKGREDKIKIKFLIFHFIFTLYCIASTCI